MPIVSCFNESGNYKNYVSLSHSTSVTKGRGSWVVGRGRGTWVPFHNIIVWKTCCRWRFAHTWAIVAKINETDVHVKYVEMCILQKVWDSSNSLNGNSCLQKLTFIRSTFLIISEDFLTRWNAITVGKRRGSEGEKVQFWVISYF